MVLCLTALCGLSRLLAQIVGGDDVRSQLSTEMAAGFSADDMKDLQSKLKPAWPPDSLALVIRRQIGERTISAYRIRKGDNASLVTYELGKDGKVARLGDSPDQEYQ
jgi:hypothetical protein